MTLLDDAVADHIAHPERRSDAREMIAGVLAFAEPRIRAEERARHHRMEVQGGYVRTCCPMCKSHVQPHVRCMLRDDYTGPLPEGHRWDDDA